jgi:hypothetical protein
MGMPPRRSLHLQSSPKHIALYQKFGFWAQFLTPVMSKQVAPSTSQHGYMRFSELPGGHKEAVLAECCKATSEIYEGLEVS